jgi:ribonucleoside-triphosphate reductase (thioredoxin)
MSVKMLQEYTRYSKYSKYIPEKKRRETWEEQVNRVFDMHEVRFGDKINSIKDDFEFAKNMVLKKRVLGSQRALQFGGKPILDKNAKMYNCTVSYVDRPRFFQECMYLLLCGCGTGFSVQKHHIQKLPGIMKRTKGEKNYIIPDSIEGWADAVGILISSYFVDDQPFKEYNGYKIKFDYTKIRPAGAALSWGGKAPGPKGLQASLDKIEEIFETVLKSSEKESPKLRPIDAYDMIMHLSDAVISGGVRRSACISIFSADDMEMANAKTGDWFIKNPQRGRSNNSALLIRNETTKEDFTKLMKSVKEFGEPGFIWSDSKESLYNPCVEINMYAYNDEGKSGWQFCNLCEINMKKCKTKEEFLDSCKASAILGTLQASYDKFDYLGEISEQIVKKEALLGCSMTGMMDSPDIAFNPEIQKEGAQLILEVNERIAKSLGVNKCARATCVKPAGSTSCLLGSASGIHPHHARRYFRRVQANVNEAPLKYFQAHNPRAVETSVWSNTKTDMVISFLCEVPDGAKIKNQVNAIQLLDHVKLTQQNWVEFGTRKDAPVAPWLRHNVSNTITVKDDEWDGVTDYIYENRKWFAGISLLPMSGDLDYPQAPFTTVLEPKEILAQYGEGSLFASGLIVDGLKAFNDNLWAACDCALGIGEKLSLTSEQAKLTNGKLKALVDKLSEKEDWIRRFKQFAERYCNGDLRRCSHLLKHVTNYKLWVDLQREYQPVDWSLCYEDDFKVDVTTLAGQACAGGACEMK